MPKLVVIDAAATSRAAPILVWLDSQGIRPDDCRRVEVLEDEHGLITATVSEFLRNEQGLPYCPVIHDHRADTEHCEQAARTYQTPVTSLPPET